MSTDQPTDVPAATTTASDIVTSSQPPHRKKRRRTSDDLVETQNVDFDLALNRIRTRGLSRKIQEEEEGIVVGTPCFSRNRRYEIYATPQVTKRAYARKKHPSPPANPASYPRKHRTTRTPITASSSDESPSPHTSSPGASSASTPPTSDATPPKPRSSSLPVPHDSLSHLTSLLTAIHNPDTTAPDAHIDPALLVSLRQAMEQFERFCDGHEDPAEGRRVMAVCEDILSEWLGELIETCGGDEVVDIEEYEESLVVEGVA